MGQACVNCDLIIFHFCVECCSNISQLDGMNGSSLGQVEIVEPGADPRTSPGHKNPEQLLYHLRLPTHRRMEVPLQQKHPGQPLTQGNQHLTRAALMELVTPQASCNVKNLLTVL